MAGLARITDRPDHVSWPDSIPFTAVQLQGVVGHRQVTNAYLAQLARHHGGRLATFDGGLAALHSDVAELIPVQEDDRDV
jgi:predicted nucleic acid-binding protein